MYEVRVSYLGTAPYAAMLALHCSAASPASRTLLDIEKITLSTDAQGGVIVGCTTRRAAAQCVEATSHSMSAVSLPQGCAESQATVELSFAFTGRGPTAEREAGVRQRPVEYVAVCESLLVPGLPRYIPAVGLLCLAVLAAAFRSATTDRATPSRPRLTSQPLTVCLSVCAVLQMARARAHCPRAAHDRLVSAQAAMTCHCSSSATIDAV